MNDQNSHQNNHQGSHRNSRQYNHPHRRCGRGGKKATVVIPNYNGLSSTEPYFKALELQIRRDFKALVVDSGSMDKSVEWLKDQGMTFILLDSNTGFSGVVDRGIRAASTLYVILFNNDAELDCYYVDEMIKTIGRSLRIFFVSSKMIQIYHKELMGDAGGMYSLLGWASQRGVDRSSTGYNRARHAFSACAGAAIYRRKISDETGYFDEMYFVHLEDTDVGYRARIAGYDNIYCPLAVVYHVGSGVNGSKHNSFEVKLTARNNVHLDYKNIPALQLAVNLFPIMAGIAVKYVLSRRIGPTKDYAEGLKRGIAAVGTYKEVPYDPRHPRNYFIIGWELLTGTLIYLYEFTARRIAEL